MTVPGQPRSILLIEPNPDLREVESLILSDAGYHVDSPAPATSPVAYAARHRPDAIVLHLGRRQPGHLALVDQFQGDPATKKIPLVVIASAESVAAEAQAGPNVDSAIVAPYDITALEEAVASALGNPPPAAALPNGAHPPSAGVALAAKALDQQTRDIVLQTLEQLREHEPYRSRFDDITRGLVDALGSIVGAIATGIERGLSPRVVYATDVVTRDLREHALLRQSQGIDVASAVREIRALGRQLESALAALAGPNTFSADDVAAVAQRIREYIDELTRLIVGAYRPWEHRFEARNN